VFTLRATGYGPSCEPWGPVGWLQPVSAWTSFAYVVVGLGLIAWVLLRRPREPGLLSGVDPRSEKQPTASANPPSSCGRSNAAHRRFHTRGWLVIILALLAIGNGIGSIIQHGPEPWWNEVVHDPPLIGALAFVAADAFADLTGRRLHHWWWAVPTLLTALAALAWHPGSLVLMLGSAVAGIGLSLLRVIKRPAIRRPAILSLTLLAVGGLIGTLGVPGRPLCLPDSAFFASGWSTHSIWHVMSAVAFIPLALVVGSRLPEQTRGAGHRLPEQPLDDSS
jgi:hypothetical protein